jgi:thiamine-phosphate pyrophosphorylase
MSNRRSVKRIIDVNLNRACEGLRVIEDIVRFILDDKSLTKRVKKERHTLRRLFSKQTIEILSERDSQYDVGRKPSKVEEFRKDIPDIVMKNSKRVEESLRSLEEVSKLSDEKRARTLKEMRFRLYSLGKEVQSLLHSQKGLGHEGIYLILPDRKPREIMKIVNGIVGAPIAAIQMRCKKLPANELVALGRRIRTVTAHAGISFIVNDRVDIGLAVGADGVHIGQDDIGIREVRRIGGSFLTIGVSTHSIAEAKRAEREDADYIAFGSIFKTTSKDNAIIQGISKLKRVRREVDIPIVAIGGINETNIKDVSAAGADYAAVISSVSDADDPKRTVKKLYRGFKRGKKSVSR